MKNIDVAKKFYEETLELQPSKDQEPGTLSYDTPGSTIFVYPSQYAGTNEATALTWVVNDVEKTVGDLKSKGVKFEHYDNLPETKRQGDIHTGGDKKLAWFKDPDGNIHALIED